MQASLKGIKIPIKYNYDHNTPEFTKEEDEQLTAALIRAQQRKTAERMRGRDK